MSKALVAAVILLVATAGIATVTALSGHYPLALLSYRVVSNNSSSIEVQGNITVIKPAIIDLGNLTAGEKGNYTAIAEIAVNSSGWFKIELNDDVLHGVFSHFMAKITIGNETVTLAEGGKGKGHDSAIIYLSKGVYNVTIVIYYIVSPHPENRTVSNVPLLIIKPADHHGH